MFLNKRKRALALIITGVGLVTLTAKGSANTVGQSFSSIFIMRGLVLVRF